MKTLAIIVNYKRSDLVLEAVESVLVSETAGPVEIAVVDNSESAKEAEKLKSGLPPSAHLFLNEDNMGFGRACNLAAANVDSDAVLLLNPDAKILPKCLKRLQYTLFASERVAAVSPQIFWDESMRYYFPPPCSPDLMVLFEAFSLNSSAGYRLNSFWRRSAIRAWRSTMPLHVSNFSGGLALLKRSLVEKAGGFFDPRFFLYYEDTDLAVRLRRMGFKLLLDPKARAVHYYDQCGLDRLEKKREFMRRSRSLFMEKHAGISRINRLLNRAKPVLQRFKGVDPEISAHFTGPFTLKVPPVFQQEWLFEWSPSEDFWPAAGCFGSGENLIFSESSWRKLAPGRYYGRIGSSKRFSPSFKWVSWQVS